MTYDYIVRHVRGYGFLPIVRDWNKEKEVYRGEYKDGMIEALETAVNAVDELAKKQTIDAGLDIIREHMKENG